MPDLVPNYWAVHKLGYKYCVNVSDFLQYASWGQLWHWLEQQHGGISNGLWIDQGVHVCFVDESHAVMFEITWSK